MPDTDLEHLLHRHFGFEAYLPGQREVIASLLGGHSAAAVFPTGGGKSLCYQLPALELPGLTVVVSPLIALMKDQVDALAARGHRALRLDSSIDAEAYRSAMTALRAGEIKLLYVAPERFNNERFREMISGLEVSLFAVDEAHCISEWGHNFRPDYLKLVRYANECKAQRKLALTATATDPVLQDICDAFDVAAEHAVRTQFFRPNLSLITTPVEGEHRYALLEQRIRERDLGATIVYVTRQRQAEEIAERLATAGFAARAYHAGMKNEARDEVQEWFFQEPAPIVVATIAFGMGIDKPDIRAVYHHSLPKSLENYSQEIGRAGRDGERSWCELFACADDLCALENFVYGDTPSGPAVRTVLGALFETNDELSNVGDWVELSLYDLSAKSDMRQIVVQTLLTYLELDGLLQAGTPYYSQYDFQPKVPSAQILESFDGERRDFVRHLLANAKKRRKWFSLDVDAACESYQAPRARALRALEFFEANEWMELRASGVRHRYRILERPASLDALTDQLSARFLRREAAELERLQQVIEFIEADACRARLLSEHFSESLDQACGYCSWCLGDQQPVQVPDRRSVAVDDITLAGARVLAGEEPEALAEPRALARFLCGLTSPKTTRHRLRQHPLFGSLSAAPFRDVLKRIADSRSAASA